VSAGDPGPARKDRAELETKALEAVRLVAKEYGIATRDLKPCIAHILDGNFTSSLQDCAFTLAMECRRLDLDQSATVALLNRWARKVGCKQRVVDGAIKSALRRNPDGKFKYHPPGLINKQGGRYAEVLGGVCAAVGCPSHCPALSSKYQGPVTETFEQFEQLGWAKQLKRSRRRSAIDVYAAICRREKQLHLAPGVELRTGYRQLAELAGVHYTTVGDALRQLSDLGLIEFVAGSGSGPNARDRVASAVRRITPIPGPPRVSGARSKAAITTGCQHQPQIGRATTRQKVPSSTRASGTGGAS
jgi:hypothetical protein